MEWGSWGLSEGEGAAGGHWPRPIPGFTPLLVAVTDKGPGCGKPGSPRSLGQVVRASSVPCSQRRCLWLQGEAGAEGAITQRLSGFLWQWQSRWYLGPMREAPSVPGMLVLRARGTMQASPSAARSSQISTVPSLDLGHLEKNEIPYSRPSPQPTSGIAVNWSSLSGKETEAERRRDPITRSPASAPPHTHQVEGPGFFGLRSWGFGEHLTLASFSDLVTETWFHPPVSTTVFLSKAWVG